MPGIVLAKMVWLRSDSAWSSGLLFEGCVKVFSPSAGE